MSVAVLADVPSGRDERGFGCARIEWRPLETCRMRTQLQISSLLDLRITSGDLTFDERISRPIVPRYIDNTLCQSIVRIYSVHHARQLYCELIAQVPRLDANRLTSMATWCVKVCSSPSALRGGDWADISNG